MDRYHSILRRQARRAGIKNLDDPPGEEPWLNFIKRLHQSFESADRDRYLLERSLDLSSKEMQGLHKELAREKELLQIVLDTLPRGIIYLSPSWEILFSNRAARGMFLTSENKIEGQILWDMIHIKTSPSLDHETISRVLSLARMWWEDDCEVLKSQEESFPANIAFHPMLREEELSGIVVTIEDITERKLAKRAVEEARVEASAADKARQAQAAFLANMSHELRTPLNTIIGYAELLWEESRETSDNIASEFAEDLDKIHTAGRHLLSLINDVLDMSKIQSGHYTIHPETFELGGLLEDVGKTVRHMVEKNGNELVIESDETSPKLFTDSTKLRQVLINLISNAAKFTKQGTISLIQTNTVYQDEPALSFQVVDTGIGIDANQLPTLFDAFTQAHGAMNRTAGGTGLGLAITKSICEALGGEISVKSIVGTGTTFTLILPNAYKQLGEVLEETSENLLNNTIEENTEPEEEIAFQEQTCNLLLIDDDVSSQDLIQRYIRPHGFVLRSTNSAQEGIALARELKPDAIIMDMLLPDLSGWELLSILKTDPETHEIPIIVLSIPAQNIKAATLGVYDYLIKPIDRHRLLDSLTRLRAKKHISQPNVLIVEDEEDIRFILKRKMLREGWAVSTSNDGEEAIRTLENSDQLPHVILLDLMMPKMDGYTFIRHIQSDPSWSKIPIVVLSATSFNQEQLTFLKKHTQSILSKGAVGLNSELLDTVLVELEQIIARVAIEKAQRKNV